MAKKPLPDVETLRKLLDYNPETGILTWRPREPEWFKDTARRSKEHMSNNWNAENADREAFTAVFSGYRVGKIFDVSLRAHRVIWAMQTGEWPISFLDHINGDRADNRIANLRLATPSENARNSSSYRNSTSRFRGVSWHQKAQKWVVQIRAKDTYLYLGLFDCEEHAANVYDAFARIHHGKFARLNFPEGSQP